jgi:hypothetical protein
MSMPWIAAEAGLEKVAEDAEVAEVAEEMEKGGEGCEGRYNDAGDQWQNPAGYLLRRTDSRAPEPLCPCALVSQPVPPCPRAAVPLCPFPPVGRRAAVPPASRREALTATSSGGTRGSCRG